MALSGAIRGITQLLPVIELNDAADQLSTDLARLFPVRNDPIQLTIYVEWHPTRDEPGTRALHLHGLTDTSWLVKIPMGPTLRAHTAHAT